jgi:hypothetical protein
MPGLAGDRLLCAGGVFLREGFVARGTVRLLGAEIGGDLDCNGGRFETPGGNALACDRATIGGGAFLNDGFVARGTVRLLGAQIGGNLDCGGGRFETPGGNALSWDRATIGGNVFLNEGFVAHGKVRLLGAEIGGDLACVGGRFEAPGGTALHCDGATIGGTVFLRRIAAVRGAIDFASTSAGALVDDARCWAGRNDAAEGGRLVLDGFTYQRIGGGGPTDGPTRTKWLMRQRRDHLGEDFCPQPWEQAVKVLREMGHPADAQEVAMAKQWLIVRNRWVKARREWAAYTSRWPSGLPPVGGLLWLAFQVIYGGLIGFGHRPIRTVVAMVVVWFGCTQLYALAADQNVMAPTTPLVHLHVLPGGQTLRGACFAYGWANCPSPPMPPEYTTFNAHLYSLDLILPLVDLQQSNDWAPMVNAGGSLWVWRDGYLIRAVMWFQILFGWVASLLLAAVLSGLAKKD